MPFCLFLRSDINTRLKFNFLIGLIIVIFFFVIQMQLNDNLFHYINSALFGQFQFVGKSVGIESATSFKSLLSLLKIIIKCFIIEHIYFEKYSLFWRLLLILFFVPTLLNLKKLYNTNNVDEFKLKLSIFILAASSLVQIFPVPDIRHYFWSFSPIIPFILIESFNYYKRVLAKKSNFELFFIYIFITFFLIFTFLTLNYRVTSSFFNYKEYNEESTKYSILKGMKLNSAEKYFFDTTFNFNGKIIVPESNFEPLMLKYFSVQDNVIFKNIISNYPIANDTNQQSLKISGFKGHRQLIRNNGRIAYFNKDTLYFKIVK